MQWWQTTWGRLQPGDFVRAPDGSAWRVMAIIDFDAFKDEYALMGESDSEHRAWSPHAPDEPVTANRVPEAVDSGAEDTVIGTLRMAGFEVTEIE